MIPVVHVAADLGQGGTERSIELLATAAEGPPGQRVIALDRDGPTGERLRAALIDSLTHELRTPLTSIRAAATTLMAGEGLDDATRVDLAAVVDEEASRLDTLIGEAVEMAEIDANVVQIHAVPEHTRALLDHDLEVPVHRRGAIGYVPPASRSRSSRAIMPARRPPSRRGGRRWPCSTARAGRRRNGPS